MAGRTSSWRRVALPASILLNLFLIAVIGGHWWNLRRDAEAEGSLSGRLLARVEARLPAQDAAVFAGVLRREAPHYAGAARQLKQARRDLLDEIAAEPFDRDKVSQAFVRWGAAWTSFYGDFTGSLVDALAELPPEARARLVAERRSRLERARP